MKTNDISKFRQANHHGLSERLQECLFFLLLGLSTQDIADKMGCSFRTVRQHTHSVFDVFSVNSQIKLLAKFISDDTLEVEKQRMMWSANNEKKV